MVESRVFVFFLLSLMISFCGCSHPPNAKQIVGSWESTDKIYTLDFNKDGTFTFTKTEVKPTSLQDMVNKLGFAMIAPSGNWSLNGSTLDVNCGAVNNGIQMALKIDSWSESTLVLRFGDADAVRFVRKKLKDADGAQQGQK
jgi:hypothetical protein